MRVTYRTLRVLGAIAERSGASNRVVGELADVHDQGQISKLLLRLERLGLVENTATGGHRPTGEPNAWRLTPRGVKVERALRADDGNDGFQRERAGASGRAAPRGVSQ
jgi:DNA-binding MarR family transcriptional regulator